MYPSREVRKKKKANCTQNMNDRNNKEQTLMKKNKKNQQMPQKRISLARSI